MTKPIIMPSPYVPSVRIQQYERYLPSAFDESLSMLQKINKVIHHLNLIGEITNSVVTQWNELMEWIIGQGLEQIVSAEIDKRINDGTFDLLFSKITGDLKDLTTLDKSTLVNAINEVNQIALKNKENIGDLTLLNTVEKDTIVEAINELKFQVDINTQSPISIGEATGYGIIKGFEVIQQPVLAMAVQIGDFVNPNIIHMVNGVRYVLDSVALPVSPSSATLDRIDIVYVSKDGVITVGEGISSLNPVPPLAPMGSVLLAEILIEKNDTTVNNIDITDKREMKSLENLLTENKSNLVQAINEVINSLDGVINDAIGDVANLPTNDKTNIVNAIIEIFNEIGNLVNLKTLDKTNVVNSINEVVDNIGSLSGLQTVDKSTIVNAINEVLTTVSTIINTEINNITQIIADIVDEIGDLNSLTTVDKTTIVNAINELVSTSATKVDLGDKSNLQTNDKSNIVNAINEVFQKTGSDVSDIEKIISQKIPVIHVSSFEDQVTGVGTAKEDWTVAIQSAMDSAPQFKLVQLPMKTCRFTKTIEVPHGTSVVGYGGSSILEPDFADWQTTDYRAIHLATREGVNYEEKSYNQIFENFSVIGKNNELIESIGIDISSYTVNSLGTVNYGLIFGFFKNILVSKFDIAWNIVECWNSTFNSLAILECRIGINIVGKSVNLSFTQLMLTNFFKNHTSSSGKRYGVNMESKTYADGEGRPEGILFDNSVIFGADTCARINQVLYTRFTDCVIDGAFEDAIEIFTANGVSIKGCYIYTEGSGFSCIKLFPVAVSDSKIEIFDNQFLGRRDLGVVNQFGVFSQGVREGVIIDGNSFSQLTTPIVLSYFNNGKVINNYGKLNEEDLINFQTDGHNTVIDGNVSEDSKPVLRLHPTTSKTISIGRNNSKTHRTFFEGFATMEIGSTSVNLPNGFYDSALGYTAISKIQPLGNLGNCWVNNGVNWSLGTANCETAPTSPVLIHYVATAIPTSLTV